MRWLNVVAFVIVVALEGQVAAWPHVRNVSGHATATAVILALTESPRRAAYHLDTNRVPGPSLAKWRARR